MTLETTGAVASLVALGPLRRALALAARDGEALRWLGALLHRWLEGLGEGQRALLADQPVSLSGLAQRWDQLDADEQRAQRATLAEWLARIENEAERRLASEGLVLSPEPTEPVNARAPVGGSRAEPDREEVRSEEGLAAIGLDADTVAALSDHGVEHLSDLLGWRPVDEQRLPLIPAGRWPTEPSSETWALVEGVVTAVGWRLGAGGRRPLVVLEGEGQALVQLWSTAEKVPTVGSRRVLAAQLDQPAEGCRWWIRGEDVADEPSPQVFLRFGLEGEGGALRRAWRAVARQAPRLRDPLPAELLERHSLPGLAEALVDLRDRGLASLTARRRFAWEEAFYFSIAHAWERYAATRDRGMAHPLQHDLIGRAQRHADLGLDDDQQAALEEVKRDLRRSSPMLRVLLGAPGSGRYRVALQVVLLILEARAQVLMVSEDTAVLEQFFVTAEPLLAELGLVARLQVGTPNRPTRDALRRGEVHLLAGHLDLLQSELEFRRLGLVLSIEGSAQGSTVARLRSPGPIRSDVLILPANSFGMLSLVRAYPDADLSLIRTVRPPVELSTLQPEQRSGAYQEAQRAVAQGLQVLVVFPMVRGADAIDLREALSVVRVLGTEAFRERRIGAYHGSLSREERAKLWTDFVHRRFDVLLVTTVIEGAPRAPGLGLILVEQAEHFPRARLRRLAAVLDPEAGRGRMLLVASTQEGAAQERSFKALNGLLHHGAALDPSALLPDETWLHEGAPVAPSFGWVDLGIDVDAAAEARTAAHAWLHTDPQLRKGPATEWTRLVRERWTRWYPAEEDGGPTCALPESAEGERRRKKRRRRRR